MLPVSRVSDVAPFGQQTPEAGVIQLKDWSSCGRFPLLDRRGTGSHNQLLSLSVHLEGDCSTPIPEAPMLRESLFLLSSEKRVMRDFTILLLAVVGFAFLGAHATVKAMEWFVPVAQQTFSIPRNPAQAETRLYTVTRSVLDDRMATGSIGPMAKREADCRR
jgi:hypothetical protein